MEFKISDKSKANLENWLQQQKEAKEKHEKEIEQQQLEHFKKYHFKNRESVINHVLTGNKLYEEETGLVPRGYFFYNKEKDMIIHYTMKYNDVDCPLGMGYSSKTKEEWIKWTEWMDNENNKINGYIPYWEHE